MTTGQLVHLVIGVVVLLGLTYVVLSVGGVRIGRAPLVAIVRGSAQLSVVGLALRGVLTDPPTVAIALAVMLGVATWTAGGRLRDLEGGRKAAAVACASGAAMALTVVFALRVLPFSARYIVALGGIVIGSTMTGATL